MSLKGKNCFCAVGVCLGFAALPVWSQTFNQYVTSSAQDAFGQQIFHDSALQSTGKITSSSSIDANSATSSAESFAGTLKVFSASTSSATQYQGFVPGADASGGTAFASFLDQLKVTSLDPTITSGVIKANLQFNGTLFGESIIGAAVLGSSSSQVIVSGFGAPAGQGPTGGYPILGTRIYDADVNPGSITVPKGSILQLEIPFKSGELVDFGVGIYVNSGAQTYRYIDTAVPTVSSSADFSGSLYWGGIAGVEVGGSLVSMDQFKFQSTSGVDYTRSFAPVPEPQAYAVIAGVGMLCLGVLRGAKGRRRNG